jgi:hypothetical protein
MHTLTRTVAPLEGAQHVDRAKEKGKIERKEIVKRLSQDFIRPRQQVKTHYTDRRGSDVTARLEEPHSCRIEGATEVKQNHSEPLNTVVQTKKKD